MNSPDAFARPEHTPVHTSGTQPTRRFGLGQVVATPGALALLAIRSKSPWPFLARHVSGDWGDLCHEDRAANEAALTHGTRVMSVYRLVNAERLAAVPPDERDKLPTLWIITDAADATGIRRTTTLLLPEEY